MDPVQNIVSDIANLSIQGATNIAFAVLDTLHETLQKSPDISPETLKAIAEKLAYARPTEPLAQNAVRYIFDDPSGDLQAKIDTYRTYIAHGKAEILKQGTPILKDGGSYLTLCHSSTVTALMKNARTNGAYFSVYVAETRPLYQGRITAKELLNAGFDDITMIIDDVAVSLIEGRKGKIDAVLIGADLLSEAGFVNKVGSLAVTFAANRHNIPVYSLTTLLKYDPRPFHQNVIETRNPKEIWIEAPEKLQFYAPAFDFVPYIDNVHIICEKGILPGSHIRHAVNEIYPFIHKTCTL